MNTPLCHRIARRAGTVARYIFFMLAAVFLMINVHEIGHTVFARLFGDATATYALYRLHPNGGIACIGCNIYHEASLSFVGQVVVSLGGVIFSQGLALAALWLANKTRWKRFWRVVSIVSAFDAAFQVAQGIAAHIAQQTALTRVDMADVIWLVSNRTHLNPGFIKGIIAAMLLAYLWWFARLYRKTRVLSH